MKEYVKTGIRKSYTDSIFDIINYSLMFIWMLVVLYPLIFVLSASISDPSAVYQGRVWLFPKDLTFEGYSRIFDYRHIWIGYRNTLFYTGLGLIISLTLTISAAYVLSRKEFYLRGFITVLFTFTMFFSGGMIPTYILIRNLGMLNKIWAIVLPNAVGVWNIIIARTYMQTVIPEELRNASAIDGCDDINYLIRIVIPLSAPIIAVMTLFYGVGYWNEFFSALLYISNRELYPLQLVLRNILIQNEISTDMVGREIFEIAERQRIADVMKYGVIIVSSLPVLMMYPFLQKYFVKGIMIGSIKG